MEIEKQRGISVTSSAMQFSFHGYHLNILDTPGHQDFSEDTYRVLVAADAAVMLIDAAKGVEAQTIKLFKVCRMRGIPIFTFVNKMDRASKDPFALMEDIENVLGIRTCPMNWPIGVDGDFQGVYLRDANRITCTAAATTARPWPARRRWPPILPRPGSCWRTTTWTACEARPSCWTWRATPSTREAVLHGKLTPMFFGSAITNFGVEPFLEAFLNITPPPLPRMSDQGEVRPESDFFSGFVFKIQANMNPAHRDRLAFVRVVSGEFKKGMNVWLSGDDKLIQLKQPQQFMANEREAVETAYPGDIVGLFDPGFFHLGDTLSDGPRLRFSSIPIFAPEHFARVRPEDSMKRKQFLKGMSQLAEEGAIQLFTRTETGFEELLCGVVGMLQFDVLTHRLRNGVRGKPADGHARLPLRALGHAVPPAR
jgi:peptide chain release factor 3